MTIDELRLALERIPNTGAINKARRRALALQIAQLQNGGGALLPCTFSGRLPPLPSLKGFSFVQIRFRN